MSSVFAVAKASQTITFGSLANKTFGDAPLNLSATASSGLAVSFSVLSGPATISGSTLTMTGAGTVTVRASQPGDTNWSAALPVDQSFSVAKGSQSISFGSLPSKTYGDAPFGLSATASSGLAVSFSILSGPATISGSTLTMTGAGTVTVRASQAGNTNWNSAAPVDQAFTVGKGSQSISFGSLPNKTYGDAPFSLSATASSSLAVSFSVLSGPATISGSTLTMTGAGTATVRASQAGCVVFSGPAAISGSVVTITGAGTVTVRASQTGDTNWNAAAPVYQAFTVAQTTITVTADNKSKVCGAANPPLTASYSGFVNGDTSSVISGAPNFSTTANTNSTVAGSPYTITVTQGTLSAANYFFTFVNGTLNVTPAFSTVIVAASANPSPTGSNVTFTATVSTIAPSTGLPSGTVQFKADGSALGSPVGLNLGVAGLTLSSLPHGTHIITAEYGGDGNFLGSTNSLGSNQVVNIAPVASPATYTRPANSFFKIYVPDMLANYTSDADGDATLLVSVGSGSNGATIFVATNYICYLPSDADPNRNSTDHFDYTISDGFAGCLVTNQIAMLVNNPAAAPAVLTGIMAVTNCMNLQFTGCPNYTYHVERAAILQSSNGAWQNLGPAATDANGKGVFTDTAPPANQAYYRIVWP